MVFVYSDLNEPVCFKARIVLKNRSDLPYTFKPPNLISRTLHFRIEAMEKGSTNSKVSGPGGLRLKPTFK